MPVSMQCIKMPPKVIVATDLCKGCNRCVEVCPKHGLLPSERFNRQGYHPVKFIEGQCTGCGVCFYVCPEPGAITVLKAPTKFVFVDRETYRDHIVT